MTVALFLRVDCLIVPIYVTIDIKDTYKNLQAGGTFCMHQSWPSTYYIHYLCQKATASNAGILMSTTADTLPADKNQVICSIHVVRKELK